MAENKPIKADVSGFRVMKTAILDLLNSYPGLSGQEITFGGLTEDGGISMESESGALVTVENTDIVGNVHQTCQFPFFVVWRGDTSTERQKLLITELLDTLGAWLCREPVTIDGTEYRLAEYPLLTGGRRITDVTRTNNYALIPNSNGTQDWVLPVTVFYTNDFKKV